MNHWICDRSYILFDTYERISPGQSGATRHMGADVRGISFGKCEGVSVRNISVGGLESVEGFGTQQWL